METYIPANSPLIGLNTCPTCPEVGYYPDGLGAQSVLFAGGSISLNFTGTALQLNHTTSPAITLQYSFNNTIVQPLASSSALGQPITLTNFQLPLGRHELRMEITGPENGLPSDTSLIHGATITSGQSPGSGAREMGIDDSDWRTGAIVLTEGWNMLETPFEASNFIDTDLVQAEFGTLGNDSGESISFTQRAGSAMSISFQGQAAWAYGISGEDAGAYTVQLDDGPPERFEASGGPRSYGSLLYHASDLVAGNHTLRFTNMENGRRFSFDRLIVVDGLVSSMTPPLIVSSTSSATRQSTFSSTPTRSSSSSSVSPAFTDMPDQDRSHLSGAAITGILVGVAGVITVLAFLGWWFFKRSRKRRSEDHAQSLAQEKKRITFFRFSDSHTKSGDRKTFNRLNSPLGTGTETTFSKSRRSKYKSNPFGITGFRFPGLRSNPSYRQQQTETGRMEPGSALHDLKDTKHQRQRSFLDMDMDLEVQPEAEHQHHSHSIPGLNMTCLASPRPVSTSGERRILPIHHANMGGESPLTELVRYSPHDSTYSQASYAYPQQTQHPVDGRDRSYMDSFGHKTRPSNAGSGRTGMTAGSGWILGPSQPVAAQAAASHPWPRPSGPGGAL